MRAYLIWYTWEHIEIITWHLTLYQVPVVLYILHIMLLNIVNAHIFKFQLRVWSSAILFVWSRWSFIFLNFNLVFDPVQSYWYGPNEVYLEYIFKLLLLDFFVGRQWWFWGIGNDIDPIIVSVCQICWMGSSIYVGILWQGSNVLQPMKDGDDEVPEYYIVFVSEEWRGKLACSHTSSSCHD